MKNSPPRIPLLSICLFIASLFFSCSKDSDLLADYVAVDSQSTFVEIKMVTILNESIVFSVIEPANDSSKTVVTAVTQPANGTATVNEDYTITYTSNATGNDEIEFTTQTTNTDETVTTETGSVKVTTVNSELDYWKTRFDSKTADDDYQTRLTNSGDAWDIYYLDVSPYVYMFQVTGTDSYMDFGVNLFEKAMGNSVNVVGGYKGWLDGPGGIAKTDNVDTNLESNLAESRGMRTVARMLWVLSKSPTYLSKGTNQAKFDSMLAWFTRNIWDKWESRGIHQLYRSHTHMSSHWGQIAWFLSEIKGEQKYRTIYTGWSSGITEGSYQGESMRGQLREIDLTGGNGYIWAGPFGNQNSTNDVSHANAEVELMVLGAEMSDYWTNTDMQKISRTFDQLICKNNSAFGQAYRIDGSGSGDALFEQGWVQLGRFSETLQAKLKARELVGYNHNQKTYLANMAYNSAYLSDTLLYPEQ